MPSRVETKRWVQPIDTQECLILSHFPHPSHQYRLRDTTSVHTYITARHFFPCRAAYFLFFSSSLNSHGRFTTDTTQNRPDQDRKMNMGLFPRMPRHQRKSDPEFPPAKCNERMTEADRERTGQ
jgi:hypothetical protein